MIARRLFVWMSHGAAGNTHLVQEINYLHTHYYHTTYTHHINGFFGRQSHPTLKPSDGRKTKATIQGEGRLIEPKIINRDAAREDNHFERIGIKSVPIFIG